MSNLKIRKAVDTTVAAEQKQSTNGERPLGYFARANYGLIEVVGADAERFVNAQTTSDVKSLLPGQFQPSALLDRKAHVVAYFNLYRTTSGYSLVADSNQIDMIVEHLDRYIFADKVELLKKDGTFTLLAGSDARILISAVSDRAIDFDNDIINVSADSDGTSAFTVFRAPLSSREVFLVYSDNQAELLAVLQKAASACQLPWQELSEDELTVERVEAGIAQMGKDFDGENLIIELGLENEAVSYTKGCFQGQEVLARVKGHGSPARQLAGLVLEFAESSTSANGDKSGAPRFKNGAAIVIDSKDTNAVQEMGKIFSHGHSAYLDKHIALALLKRDYRTPGRSESVTIESENGPVRAMATVTMLPFSEKENHKAKATALYQEALALYARAEASPESTIKAIANLRRALILDSKLEDAYEALGVILSKEGQIDEAVTLMESLAKLNPDSIMAYANLSVFYLEQNGDKEKAEEAKAQSMAIRMRLAAKEAMQQHKEKEDTAKIAAEALERKAMFEQVIEIDSEDLFANNGLGNCYNILKQYKEAEPYLLKAIAIKPGHTVAYLELGTTYEGLNEKEKALEIYKKGIDVAAQKGDMTPLKAMQARVDALS
jgi:folate-binding protein YgfZ